MYKTVYQEWPAFTVTGVTKIVASGGELYDAVRSDGRWDALRWLGGGDAPLELAAWYPAAQSGENEAAISYRYEAKFERPLGALAVASFEGKEVLEAVPDRSVGPYPLVILSSGFSIGPTSYRGWPSIWPPMVSSCLLLTTMSSSIPRMSFGGRPSCHRRIFGLCWAMWTRRPRQAKIL